MIKDILKRATAGVLSALTLLTTVPLSGAVDGGIMPLAEEDNEASSIEINVGEVYNIADKGVQKAWFQQNGAPRNVWPMFTEASDGTEIRAYCADHSKGNPGTSGMPYTVTSRVSDMHVYGVAVRSDARMTLNQFISFAGSPITAENFTADMYFSASQAAIWCALGDAQIAANSSYGVSYGSSTSLGYRAAGKTLSASSTSEALTLFAAIKMLEYGNEFYNTWGPNGKGHDAVAYGQLHGWIKGYPDGTFRPNHSITRAEAAKLINRVTGRSLRVQAIVTQFTDVPASHWAYREIVSAANQAE